MNVLVPYVTWWIDDPERLDCHMHTWHQHLNWTNGSGMLGQGWQLSRVCDLVKKTLKRHTVLEQTAIECPPSRSLIAIAIDCNCFLSLREHKKTPWRQIFIYNIFWMHTCKSYSNMHWCIIYSADTRKNTYTCIQNKTQTHAHTHRHTHTPDPKRTLVSALHADKLCPGIGQTSKLCSQFGLGPRGLNETRQKRKAYLQHLQLWTSVFFAPREKTERHELHGTSVKRNQW